MLALILGGAASGKSEYAERLVLSRPGPHFYLATMEPWGEEGQARVRKHRGSRSGRGFRTVERYVDLSGLSLPSDAGVLLEDLGNLTANELFRPDGGGEDAVTAGLAHLAKTCRNLIVVSNEIFSGGQDYGEDTVRYLEALASLNRSLAARADLVVEVVCGLPDLWKGELPWEC